MVGCRPVGRAGLINGVGTAQVVVPSPAAAGVRTDDEVTFIRIVLNGRQTLSCHVGSTRSFEGWLSLMMIIMKMIIMMMI